MIVRVGVSRARDSHYFFRLLRVDFEVRLYQDGVQVFGKRKGRGKFPAAHPLQRSSGFHVRYNNNDSGPGFLHFQIIEGRTDEEVRYEFNVETISSPDVLDLKFRLRQDPELDAPA